MLQLNDLFVHDIFVQETKYRNRFLRNIRKKEYTFNSCSCSSNRLRSYPSKNGANLKSASLNNKQSN
jgi:hypothetical protein